MKILLCCNAGMSSSILVEKIKQAAKKRQEDVDVKAVASARIKEELNLWDVCLVGPQLVYAVESIKEQIKIPVSSIPPRIYAMADGDAALDLAKSMIKE